MLTLSLLVGLTPALLVGAGMAYWAADMQGGED
jgi:hypothetical protein